MEASQFCLQILEAGDLASKLAAPPADLAIASLHAKPDAIPDRPVRDAGLRLSSGSRKLPRPGQLADPRARALCLARFAHHELMAVELFAWAILRFGDQPESLRRGWLRVLGEEQLHCRLYLERLAALGYAFTDFEHSDYFWKHIPSIRDSPRGVGAFLCAVGLTFEQANLDFTPRYARAFREAGDEAAASVCDRVHADEIGHVALAASWLLRLDGVAQGRSCDLTQRYEAAIPFPLSAARAKGRPFDTEARRRAGLDERFIEHVRTARSSAELAGPAAAPDGAPQR